MLIVSTGAVRTTGMSAPPIDAVMCAPKKPEPAADNPSSAHPICQGV